MGWGGGDVVSIVDAVGGGAASRASVRQEPPEAEAAEELQAAPPEA